MKTYDPGPGNVKDLNKKLKEYREVERQIDQAIAEKRQELARIQTAKRKLKAKATYAPTPEALEYQARHGLRIAQQPRPVHGGPTGLRLAGDESEAYDRRKAHEMESQ